MFAYFGACEEKTRKEQPLGFCVVGNKCEQMGSGPKNLIGVEKNEPIIAAIK